MSKDIKVAFLPFSKTIYAGEPRKREKNVFKSNTKTDVTGDSLLAVARFIEAHKTDESPHIEITVDGMEGYLYFDRKE